MAKTKMLEQFEAARYASTPLIAVLSADPQATIDSICGLPKLEVDELKNLSETPIVQWDRMRGVSALTTEGSRGIAAAGIKPNDAKQIVNPADALILAAQMPAGTIFFMHAMHLFIKEPDVQQGLWNLRDQCKGDFRSIVSLAPSLDLPELLRSDMTVFNEPLPTSDDLRTLVNGISHAAHDRDKSIKLPTPQEMERALEALCGLAAFPAEQVTTMCMTDKGLDFEMMWERKRQAINATHGLSVWKGDKVNIGGLVNSRSFLSSIIGNFSCIVLLDELEKLTAGAGTDTSGSTTKQVGSFLTWSSDRKMSGVMAMGVRGAGKTILAKWLASQTGKMLIVMNIAAMEGSLVGESVANLEASFKVIDAVAMVKPPLFIGTTNNVEALSPELRRRFNLCTFFFDLPDGDERKEIWPIHLKAYDVADRALPEDHGWTGAEIESCCQLAKLTGKPLKHAAQFIVPVLRSSPESVDYMRSMAHQRYVSASHEGLYEYSRMKEEETQIAKKLVRAIATMPSKPAEA